MAVQGDPALVIIVGVRTIISMVGMITVLMAYWWGERKWDEEGALAYAKAAENGAGDDYQVVDESTGAAPAADAENPSAQTPEGANTSSRTTVVVPKEDLMAAAPHPKLMLAGFATWAFSFFYVPWAQSQFYFSVWNMSAVILMVTIGILICFPLRRANIERNAGSKFRVSLIISALTVALFACTVFDPEINAPYYATPFAALFFFLSYQAIRRNRKMGISWDKKGRPAKKIATQNHGFVHLFFALFLFWMGSNAVYWSQDYYAFIPIHNGARTWLAFIAGPNIILHTQLLLDRAFDDGSAPMGRFALNGESLSVLFPENLKIVASVLETPLVYLTGWILLAVAQFFPLAYGFNKARMHTVVFIIVSGGVYAIKVMPCYWKGFADQYRWWYGVYLASMVMVGVCVGLHSWNTGILSAFGVFFILFGQYKDMYERKRGFFWLYERGVNPNPTVFGMGQPLHMVGWIFLCIAMSAPY